MTAQFNLAREAHREAIAAYAADVRGRLKEAWLRLRRAGPDMESARTDFAILEAPVYALPPDDMWLSAADGAETSDRIDVEADQPVIVCTRAGG